MALTRDQLAQRISQEIEDGFVVNLGIGGSSIDVACINSLTLYKHYPKPKAVIQLWTFPYRYANFEEQEPAVTIRPNSDNYHFYNLIYFRP